MSNYTYSTGGKLKVPLVVRAVIGRGWGQERSIPKAPFSNFTHIPGLKVIAPTTPSDMKGMMTAAHPRRQSGDLLRAPLARTGPRRTCRRSRMRSRLGVGRILRPGKDVTVVGLSWMNVEARLAADILAKRGVSVEIVDPRTLAPLDEDLIVESVKRTGRCIIADCDWVDSGFSAELSAHQRGALRQARRRR